MMKNVSIRLSDNIMKEAEKLAEIELVDKSAIIREALEKGILEVKLKVAIETFSRGKASVSEASEIAGISAGELMDELTKRGIRPNITKEGIRGSLESALRVIK